MVNNHLLAMTMEELDSQISKIDPKLYGQTRNHLDGAVTHLSAYFTHGILSPVDILDQIVSKHGAEQCGKLASEFAWREYFQRVWQSRGDEIFADLKQAQEMVEYEQMPEAISDSNISCGIDVLDDSVRELVTKGYLHNHSRMWIAGVVTNIGRTHWKKPAAWMFYHLLDGDLASNTLSWQWVAGSFSHKKYIANQENLNQYSKTSQQGTWLDMSYEELAERDLPRELSERCVLQLENHYPESTVEKVNNTDHLLLYSIWNLDTNWHRSSDARRILVIEPSVYDRCPMSPKRWEFIMLWASQIAGLEIFVGELDDLLPDEYNGEITYKEYPLSNHWPGKEEPRSWIFPKTQGYYPSFSKYYKTAKKQTNKGI